MPERMAKCMKYDVAVVNGSLFWPYGCVSKEIGIRDGYITEVADRIDRNEAAQVIDAADRVIVPGFVDSHMHIEKSWNPDDEEMNDLREACNYSAQKLEAYYYNWNRESIVQDVFENAAPILKQCIVNGTSAIRTNVMVNRIVGTAALEAVNRLKKTYRSKLDILVTADCPEGMEEEWADSVRKGWIDFIGGYPNLARKGGGYKYADPKERKKNMDRIFELAKQYRLPVDVHCDESDEPDFSLFRYICERAWREQMEGMVTVSHVTALDAKGADEEAAADSAAWCAKGEVHVTTLTSQNLYLMSGGRRGATRVRQLREAGVMVEVASDNVRDIFRPFGNCDLMEEALLTAQLHKYGTDRELLDIMRMITYFPAASCRLEEYGLLPGCKANLAVLESDSVPEALRSQVKKAYVMHMGKIVAANGRMAEGEDEDV